MLLRHSSWSTRALKHWPGAMLSETPKMMFLREPTCSKKCARQAEGGACCVLGGQGHLPLSQVAPSPIQPSHGHFQRWSSPSFSGHPVPGSPHPHRAEFPPCICHGSRDGAWLGGARQENTEGKKPPCKVGPSLLSPAPGAPQAPHAAPLSCSSTGGAVLPAGAEHKAVNTLPQTSSWMGSCRKEVKGK